MFEGSTLNITKLIRSDGGIYSCEAVNSQGSTTINITVVVECSYNFLLNLQSYFVTTKLYKILDGATIKSISEHIIVNPGEEAQLSCSVEGIFLATIVLKCFLLIVYFYFQAIL